MKFEPDFEQLRSALYRGKPGRVPLLELAIAKNIKEKYLGKKIASVADDVEFYKSAGYDYIKISPLFEMNPEHIQPKEGRRISQATESTNEREWHSSGRGIITSMEDFENFRFPKPEEIDYSLFDEVQKFLPDGMKIICQYGDIFTWTWDFMGFETFSYALIDNPELVARLFDKIGSIVLNVFENCLSFDNIGALFYSDDIAINSGLFVRLDVYRQYLFPWMTKISTLCKKYDVPFIFHSDGNIWEAMDDLKKCGVDAIQPLEPQAIDIVEVKKKRGKDFCLIGNVDVDLLARGSEEQVEKEVLRLLKEVAPGGGYCLGSGNTVAEYVKFENYLTMIDTGKKYGKYPIQI